MENQTLSPETFKMNLSGIIEFWKKFLLDRNHIRIIKNKKELPEINSNPLYQNLDFVVYFPKSFPHLHDFKNNVPAANNEAIFLKGGKVYLTLNHIPQEEVESSTAWKVIISRAVGKEFKEIRLLDIQKGSFYVNDLLFNKKTKLK